jgi:hypothetical protein
LQVGRYLRRRPRRLGHRLRNVLRLPKGPRHEHPRPARPRRPVPVALRKAPLVQRHPEPASHFLCPRRRPKAHGQHQQLEILLLQTPTFAHVAQPHVPVPPLLVHRRRHRPPVPHPGQPLHTRHVRLEILAKGPQVHVEHRRLHLRRHLLGQRHLLGRVHATRRRAIPHPAQVVPRAHALHKGHLLRRSPVRRPRQAPHTAARQAHHPLELQARHHVVVHPVAVLALQPRVKGPKPRRQEHRPYLQLLLPSRHLQVHRPPRTGRHARPAPRAVRRVDDPRIRHRPQARRPVDGLLRPQPALVVVGPRLRAGCRAQPAAVALLPVHEPRLVHHPHPVARALHPTHSLRACLRAHHLGVGQQPHPGPHGALQRRTVGRLLRQHQADAARVRRKGVVQQVHRTPDGRRRVQQQHLATHLRQVHGRRHARDAPAHDQYRLAASSPTLSLRASATHSLRAHLAHASPILPINAR